MVSSFFLHPLVCLVTSLFFLWFSLSKFCLTWCRGSHKRWCAPESPGGDLKLHTANLIPWFLGGSCLFDFDNHPGWISCHWTLRPLEMEDTPGEQVRIPWFTNLQCGQVTWPWFLHLYWNYNNIFQPGSEEKVLPESKIFYKRMMLRPHFSDVLRVLETYTYITSFFSFCQLFLP